MLAAVTDTAYFTAGEIKAVAYHIIRELQNDDEHVLALPVPNGIGGRQRKDLLDHHGAVTAEIRRRGLKVKSHVRTLPTGMVLAIELLD